MSTANRIIPAFAAAVATAAIAAPVALAAIDGGDRNPSSNASEMFLNETEIVGDIRENEGGHATGTGGYTTRQSNKSDSGGGAIYGCRAKAGTESCVAANNLSNGDAFRFQSTPGAATIGQLRFGLDVNKPVDKPPFVTNGTGLVKNLNADRVDGKSAEDFAPKSDLDNYVPKGALLFAAVAADGTIGANRGVVANQKAVVDTSAGNTTFAVPFTADVSKCVATASPTALHGTATERPAVVAPSGAHTITVTEQDGGSTPYDFALQVTC
jgi:hypothetical protein